jgi:hypothetical protein
MDDRTARIELRRKDEPSLWAVVDATDLARAQQHSWRPMVRKRTSYALTTIRREDGSAASLYLHRFLLNAPTGLSVDHIDHDGLNNRRSNLRLGTQSQNLGNARNIRGGSSRFKGVTWSKIRRTWIAEIGVGGKMIYLGSFAVEEEAARAYDAAAVATWGEYACLNFPESEAVA